MCDHTFLFHFGYIFEFSTISIWFTIRISWNFLESNFFLSSIVQTLRVLSHRHDWLPFIVCCIEKFVQIIVWILYQIQGMVHMVIRWIELFWTFYSNIVNEATSFSEYRSLFTFVTTFSFRLLDLINLRNPSCNGYVSLDNFQFFCLLFYDLRYFTKFITNILTKLKFSEKTVQG